MELWRWRDWLLVVLLAGGSLVEVVQPISPPGYVGNPAINTLGAGAALAPVLVRRRYPRLYAAAVTLGTTLLWTQLRGHGGLPFVGYTSCLLASYTLGAHLPRRDAVLAGTVTFAAWGVPDVVDSQAGLPSVHQDLGFYVLVALALAAGVGLRAVRVQSASLRTALAQLEAERALREQAAAQEERRRISRDMHDVLTHTVSALAVQAGALRVDLGDAPGADAARRIEDTAREAMGELRGLLGLLHEAPGDLQPSPGLGDVERLLEPLRAGGLAVHVERQGALDDVPAGQALVAFRVVQESLTNVLKHGAAVRSVRVTLAQDPRSLRVRVEDDGRVASAGAPGRGLTGMRERVSAYGGTVRSGPGARGHGWCVEGVLPL